MQKANTEITYIPVHMTRKYDFVVISACNRNIYICTGIVYHDNECLIEREQGTTEDALIKMSTESAQRRKSRTGFAKIIIRCKHHIFSTGIRDDTGKRNGQFRLSFWPDYF